MPFEMHEEAVMARQNATYNGFADSFAGMGLQFMLFAAINMGIDILTERQKGDSEAAAERAAVEVHAAGLEDGQRHISARSSFWCRSRFRSWSGTCA